jgi:hypothetical protein
LLAITIDFLFNIAATAKRLALDRLPPLKKIAMQYWRA